MPEKSIDDVYESPLEQEPQFTYVNPNVLNQEAMPIASQEREVYRVLHVSKHPDTKEDLPAELIPANVIKSRQGNAVWGDSGAFKPTNRELLALMARFLADISAILAVHSDAEHYLVQTLGAAHFAFAGITPPCTQQSFLTAKAQQAVQPDAWSKLVHDLQTFLDQSQPNLSFKEIKINPDGHIVLRMTVLQAEDFVAVGNAIGSLFTENYQRYAGDPEKKTTLACVLAVVDLHGSGSEHRAMMMTHLQNLFHDFRRAMQGKSVPFDRIDWVEWTNRFFRAEDLLGQLSVTRGFVRLSTHNPLRDFTPCSPRVSPLAVVGSIAKNLPEACLSIRETMPDKKDRKFWHLSHVLD